MKVSTLLKLKEGGRYLVSQRMPSGEYFFFVLDRHTYKGEYVNKETIFFGGINVVQMPYHTRTSLFVDKVYLEDCEYCTLKLSAVAGLTFLKVHGDFSIHDFNFVGTYDKETLDKDIKNYKLHNNINFRHKWRKHITE